LGASFLANFMEEVIMSSYRELKSQAEDLMRQAEAARKAEIGAAIADIKEKMATYGITLEDLGGKVKGRRGRKPKVAKAAAAAGKTKVKVAKPRKPVAVKYRNSDTGETWTGRGQMSTWLKAMEAAGRKREEFLVG
jgi:DNA-binding protein H-NS